MASVSPTCGALVYMQLLKDTRITIIGVFIGFSWSPASPKDHLSYPPPLASPLFGG